MVIIKTVNTTRIGVRAKEKGSTREKKIGKNFIPMFRCSFTLSLELSWHRTIGMRCGPMPKANEAAVVFSFLDSNKRLAVVFEN